MFNQQFLSIFGLSPTITNHFKPVFLIGYILKKLALILSTLSLSCLADSNVDNNSYAVGLGVGAMYSGLGTNFALVSKTDMKYISAGCVKYSSFSGSTCGFGAGWIMTDLFGAKSNKHGVGVYVSLVDNERYTSNTSTTEGTKYFRHESDIYGAGVSYTYFINGIDRSGFNFGLSAHVTNADNFGGFLQVGYQF
tara:strand:- start:3312 stop:3893 length:582 start_codon:yes stop_codon:yes gene_type:complete